MNPTAVREVLGTYEIQAIINFAAESHVDRSINDPGIFIQTNVVGTQVLLEAAREFGVKKNIFRYLLMRSMAHWGRKDTSLNLLPLRLTALFGKQGRS